MQDQPQAGDARDDQDIQMEFYEQLGADDEQRLSEDMGYMENSGTYDSTFGETLGNADATSDPLMTDSKEEDLR